MNSNNEIRNQLIILGYLKNGKYEKDKAYEDIMESIEKELYRRMKETQREIDYCKQNLQLLEEVKNGALDQE